jgi:hydrogenase expression/formation protein HypE
MTVSNDKILLNHGSGGKLSHDLIRNIFVKYFNNDILTQQTDSAILDFNEGNLAFTTDSYVVDPVFFPGGDIGKLSVCGTINDLAVSGAKPLYLSSSFIIEEGFFLKDLEIIVKSMANEAKKAGLSIVAGDTKVVDRGKCDKIFINTTGVGSLDPERKKISTGDEIQIGDKIIVNGTIGDHGIAILAARESLSFKLNLESDCVSLHNLISEVLTVSSGIRFMRDPTRGGLATVLSELVENKAYGIDIEESSIPVKESVKGTCEIFGFDPLYMANEGKVVMVVGNSETKKILDVLRQNPLGKESAIIGEIVESHPGQVALQTEVGGKRIVDMLVGEQLPRIC